MGWPPLTFREIMANPKMQQLRNYGDERQMASCVYCGGPDETRDHVPSRVLLDEPYPENLPVLPACLACNESLSTHEEYVACVVECAIQGATRPDRMGREKIARILGAKPALVAQLEAGRSDINGATSFHVQTERVGKVVLKLAKGHAAFELNEPQLGQPAAIIIAPLAFMIGEDIQRFQTAPSLAAWPEVGSRAMQRIVEDSQPATCWIVVQAGRYRYFTAIGELGIVVRFVLSEYRR